jgi:hypothetical protein
MAKIKCTLCPVNVNHGTVDGVKTDYRANVMGVVPHGKYLFLIYLLLIFLFIYLFIYLEFS